MNLTPVTSYSMNYEYQQMDGNTSNFSKFDGELLFIEVFTTYCESCKIQMEYLLDLYDNTENKVSMLSLSVDPETDTVEKVKEYKEKYNAPWEFGIDYTEEFSEIYSIQETPTLFLFDVNGILQNTWIGLTKTSKLLNAIAVHTDITVTYQDKDESSLYLNSLTSNPFFLITAAFIVLNILFILVKSRFKGNLKPSEKNQINLSK
jgi:cytochrome oxidase Cu insertion factor (SCO1/SenC/PrrC family)